MILVADSGSTKCDWEIIDGGQRLTTETMGFNPFFHNAEFIDTKLGENELLNKYQAQITEIYFYGAGCSNTERISIVEEALAKRFIHQTTLIVEEDLNGAAYAACGHESGVVCILGTGSNACFFDGAHVRKGLPALGYVLGDEGSGSYFGKELIANFLYQRLPEELSIEFQQYTDQTVDTLVSTVYNQPNANVFLATFMKFILKHREHPYFHKMVYKGLKQFAEIHIMHHPEHKTYPVNFVGSVAYFFKDILIEVGNELGFQVGVILRKPITALADYHTKLAIIEPKHHFKPH